MNLYTRLKEIMQTVSNPDTDTAGILGHILALHEGTMILIGFAEKIKEDKFCISTIIGNGTEPLNGTEFFVGEGYLGHVVATNVPGYWSQVSKDPRASLFVRNGIHPTSIFCYPVARRHEVIGVLFGASSTESSEDTLDFLELLSLILGRQMLIGSLEENLQVRIVRLACLIELSQAIRVVENVKNILFIILDMSLNLVQGSFTCIVFQPQNEESAVELISRGIPRQTATEFGRELAGSYIGRMVDDFKGKVVPRCRRLESMTVIECPLFVGDEVVAALAVAVDDDSELEEFKQLVYVLAVIGGVALQRIHTDQADDLAREIELVHKVSAFWSQDVYQHALDMQDISVDFARKLRMSHTSIQTIAQAALLSPYDREFIHEALPDVPHHVLQALCDYQKALKPIPSDSHELSEDGQILALADYHLRKMEIEIDSIDIDLREKFELFLLQRHTESQTIPLNDAQNFAQNNVMPLPNLPVVEQLTAREKGVLEHLVTGKCNKEIAQTLFISEHTVKNHLTNIFQKLGVTDRTQAIAFILGQRK